MPSSPPHPVIPESHSTEPPPSAVQRELTQLRAVLDALSTGIVLYDADDRLVFCNSEFRRLYPQLGRHLVPGTPFEELLRRAVALGDVPEADDDPEGWIAGRLQAHRKPQRPMTRRLADGRWRHIVEQRMPDGGHLAHSVDVTDLVEREQQLAALNRELEALSQTDPLTGVANRRRFDIALAEECNRAARHGLPLAVLLLDIDHFKAYNDLHGHPAGDACLRRVAQLLRSHSQRPTDLLARMGGEEFALLLPHLDAGQAQAHAERVHAALAEAAIPHARSPTAATVTLSIGLACQQPGDDPAALLARADAALYAAKRSGRARTVAA